MTQPDIIARIRDEIDRNDQSAPEVHAWAKAHRNILNRHSHGIVASDGGLECDYCIEPWPCPDVMDLAAGYRIRTEEQL